MKNINVKIAFILIIILTITTFIYLKGEKSKEIDFLDNIYSINKGERYTEFNAAITQKEFDLDVLNSATEKYYRDFKYLCTDEVVDHLAANRIPTSLEQYCLEYGKNLEITSIEIEDNDEKSKYWNVEIDVMENDGSKEKMVIQKGQITVNEKGVVENVRFYNMKEIFSSREP